MPNIRHGKIDLNTTGATAHVNFPAGNTPNQRPFTAAPTIVLTAQSYVWDTNNPSLAHLQDEAFVTLGEVTKDGFDYRCKFTPNSNSNPGSTWVRNAQLHWVAMEGV